MNILCLWWGILSPAILYPTALALLRQGLTRFIGPDAASLICPVLLLPVILIRCKKRLQTHGNMTFKMFLQWAAVTAVLILSNALLFPGSVSWPDHLLALAVLSSIVCAPICEEMIYRELVLGRSETAFGSTAAVVLSAAVFGAVHTGWSAALMSAAVGLLLGWMRLHFHTLLAPIATHIMLNLTAFIL